jgi:hypothetical protein
MQIALVIRQVRETAMSDEERQALLARMQASYEEARRMTPEQARERLAEEARRDETAFASAYGGSPTRA